jgi:hypothetical protein
MHQILTQQQEQQGGHSLAWSAATTRQRLAHFAGTQRASRVLSQCLQVLTTLAGEPRDVHLQWQAVQRTWQSQQLAAQAEDTAAAVLWWDEWPDDFATTASPHQRQSFRYWQEQSGAGLSSDTQRQAWRTWQTSLQKVSQAWTDEIRSVQQSRTWLPLLYAQVGCRQALAREVYEAPHAAAHALVHRHAAPAHVVALLAQVRAHVVPSLRARAHASVAATSPASLLLTQKKVTLDAALLVLEQLCLDVFDLELEWVPSGQAPGVWLPDVRVLHLYRVTNDGDDRVYQGSSYFDFFGRSGKPSVSCEIPVVPGVSVVSLPFQAPVWDTDPVLLSWLDLLEFFHEMGHVLQHHSSSYGSDPSWPVDWAEVLPKVSLT